MKKLLLAFSALLGLVVCGSPLQAEAAMQAPTNAEPVSFYDKVIKMRFNVIDEDAATIAVARRKTGDAGFLESLYYEGDIALPNKVEYNDKTYRVVAIADSAFYNCKDLTSITFNKGLETIGKNAFDFCTSLDDDIRLSGDIKEIGYLAFNNCIKLASINIGKQVTTIHDGAFAKTGCPVTLDADNPNFMQTDFIIFQPKEGRLIYIDPQATTLQMPANISIIGDYAAANCKKLETLNLHEGIKKIGYQAFVACYGLSNVELPASLEEIGEAAFKYTIRLQSIKIAEGNTHFKVENKALLTADGKKLLAYPTALQEDEVKIPEGVEVIGEGTFASTVIKKVTFPESLKEVGASAFHQCVNLTEVNLPDATKKIGTQAFALCEKIRKLHVGPNLEEIGKYCFFMDIALVQLYFNCMTPPYIPSTIMGCFSAESEKNGTLYVPLGALNAYKSNDEYNGFKNIVEHDFTSATLVQQEAPFAVSVANGELSIAVSAPSAITIFTLDGANVWQAVVNATETVSLPAGSYIIKCENSSKKVVVY